MKTIILDDKKEYWYDTDVVRRVHGKYNSKDGHRNVYYEDLSNDKKSKYDIDIKNKKYILIEDKKSNKHYVAKYGLLNSKKKLLYSILKSDSRYNLFTDKGNSRLKNLGLEGMFESSKSTDFLKLLLTNTDSSDLILDFFAGSGTTGDAVMQLNADPSTGSGYGNRKYILVQLPEPIDPKKNKTAYDFIKIPPPPISKNKNVSVEPTIFDITKERLKRATKKIKTETIKVKIIEKQTEIQRLKNMLDIDGNKERINTLKEEINNLQNQDLGFKIFETTPIWEDYNFEAKKFEKQTTLFNENKLTDEDLKALLITWKTYDGSPLTEQAIKIELEESKTYTGYYVNQKLYLLDNGFKTGHLKNLLEKIDSKPDFNPTSIIAFGFHFESKNLREISENIKSYANKKQIDIDFITRY